MVDLLIGGARVQDAAADQMMRLASIGHVDVDFCGAEPPPKKPPEAESLESFAVPFFFPQAEEVPIKATMSTQEKVVLMRFRSR